MTNPCNECIISMMCKDPCNKLVNYLRLKKCRQQDYKSDYPCNFYGISWGIRNNTILLSKDNKTWRWCHDESM